MTEYDSLGRVDRTIAHWQDGVFDGDFPDEDISTSYIYDAVGNVLFTTDVLGRQNRTFYDALNRVEGTISNWDGTAVLADCAALSPFRVSNICSLHQYDDVGNTIIVTNTLGQVNRSFYDSRHRLEGSIENWDGVIDLDGCFALTDNTREENICSRFGYDSTGNQTTRTNALNQTSLTVYDEANRPFITVANWDGTPINDEADCSFPPAQPDTNLCSVTTFDTLGRRASSKDPMGNMIDFTYDGLGRLTTTTRYLDGQPVNTVTSYNALGNRLTQTDAEGNTTTFAYDDLNRLETSTSAEGVTNSQIYNAASWVLLSIDGLDHETAVAHDDLGRQIRVTDPESNTTTFEYDGLGNQTAVIDAENIRTTYVYDDLNRLSNVIENDVAGSNPTHETDVATTYLYNALGQQTNVINANGIMQTTIVYDGLNRPYIQEDAIGNQTITTYNVLGLQTEMTDGNEAVTTYDYDGLNRVTDIDYVADGRPLPTATMRLETGSK